MTERFSMTQFQKDIWEIDESDCASMFLLVGSEWAMLTDCGIGIGDLRGMAEMVMEKPPTVVINHGHVNHTGNGGQFEEPQVHPADQKIPIPMSLERRWQDTRTVARRQKGCIGAPYNTFSLYSYHINKDLRESREEERFPRIQDLYDGQQFDSGGGRIVTAHEYPGYSGGGMVLLDHQTRALSTGDALNFSLEVSAVPVETILCPLKKIRGLKGQHDVICSGHHDLRALGAPLDEDYLPDAIIILEDAMAGHIAPYEMPNFQGQSIPLESGERVAVAPPGSDKEPRSGKRTTLRRGRVSPYIDPNKIWEEGEENGR